MPEKLQTIAFIGVAPARLSPRRFLHAFRIRPPRSEATKRIKKMKNRILAIPAEAAATPPKPNTAATNATTRKISVQRNMGNLLVSKSIPTIPERVHGASPHWNRQSALRSIFGG
jgi:hypothetical protein